MLPDRMTKEEEAKLCRWWRLERIREWQRKKHNKKFNAAIEAMLLERLNPCLSRPKIALRHAATEYLKSCEKYAPEYIASLKAREPSTP